MVLIRAKGYLMALVSTDGHETQPLLKLDEVLSGEALVNISQRHKRFRIPHRALILALLASTVFVVWYRLSGGSNRVLSGISIEVPHQTAFFTATGTDYLSFRARNLYYNETSRKPGKEYPWLKDKEIVEPFRLTTLSVNDPLEDRLYLWDIRAISEELNIADGGSEGDSPTPKTDQVLHQTSKTATGSSGVAIDDNNEVHIVLRGQEVQTTFSIVGWYTVSLSEMTREGSITRSVDTEVACRYVRRELGELTVEDREALLDTMKVLYELPLKVGREVYGDEYIDLWSLYKIHFRGASDKNCDRFHDGLGFTVAHSMITNVFEEALQVVNPSVTMPYWDFTRAWDKLDHHYNGRYEMLEEAMGFWTPEWFGGVNLDEDMVVTDGRWAYTPVPFLSGNDFLSSTVGNVYGLMRSPWNTNNVPFLTRAMGRMCGTREVFFSWPTCESHYNLIMDFNSLYDFVWDSMYDPHGAVHTWIGGDFGCTEMYDAIADLVGEHLALDMRSLASMHRKNAWRYDIFKCRGTAGLDMPQEEVMSRTNENVECGCLDFDLSNDDDLLDLVGKFQFMDTMLQHKSIEVKRGVMTQMCSGVMNDGSQLTSSSPLDPAFWPIHPTMERLYTYKMLSGTMTDMYWPSEGSVRVDEDGNVHRTVIQMDNDHCVGHLPDSQFPYNLVLDWEDIPIRLTLDGVKQDFKLTNVEVLNLMDPSNTSLSYIYDNFDWPHCTSYGFDFRDVWKSNDPSEDKQKEPVKMDIDKFFSDFLDKRPLPPSAHMQKLKERYGS